MTTLIGVPPSFPDSIFIKPCTLEKTDKQFGRAKLTDTASPKGVGLAEVSDIRGTNEYAIDAKISLNCETDYNQPCLKIDLF